MTTRALLAGLLAVTCLPAPAAGAEAFIVLQRSPLAGFRHHDGPHAWPLLRRGDPVELVREPHNPHDANAVRVRWKGRTLGYVPRLLAGRVARHLDAGAPLEGRIALLQKYRNGSVRIEFDIMAPLQREAAPGALRALSTH